MTADDGWKYEFTDLDVYNAGRRITYTIAEEVVANYSTVIKGYNITNIYTPQTEITTTPAAETPSAPTTGDPTTSQTTTKTPAAPETTTGISTMPQTTTETPATSVTATDSSSMTATTSQTAVVQNPATSQAPAIQNQQTTAPDQVTNAQGGVPSTGDHSHMGLFGLIMAVCAGAIAVNLVLRRKNREQK